LYFFVRVNYGEEVGSSFSEAKAPEDVVVQFQITGLEASPGVNVRRRRGLRWRWQLPLKPVKMLLL
jgi:hypothetical protein